MKQFLLPEGGRFYKANMHTHTNISDGQFSPEEIKKLYMEKGYSIVAYTDHEVFVPQNGLTDENFVAINSVEAAKNDGWHGGFAYNKCYHINFYAKDPNATHCPVLTPSPSGWSSPSPISPRKWKRTPTRVITLSQASTI